MFFFVHCEPSMVSYDGCILTPEKILDRSGHLTKFFDLITICTNCKKKKRITTEDEKKKHFFCDSCKVVSTIEEKDIWKFSNLLSLSSEPIYLRPETCQNIFVNFEYIKRVTRSKTPFGVVQIGKSFRNEPTMNHGVFRTREFEQMELEFFSSSEEEANRWWDHWRKKTVFFLRTILGDYHLLSSSLLPEKDLPHYSKKTEDFFYEFHFGKGEICSNSQRGNYDLKTHLGIYDVQVTEFSFGVERLCLAILENSFFEDLNIEKKEKKVLSLFPILSPYFCTVVSAGKAWKKESNDLFLSLIGRYSFRVGLEEAKSVGKAYHHQDEIGTFFCITIDKTYPKASIRYRDTKKQIWVQADEIGQWLEVNYWKYKTLFIEFKNKKG